MEKRIQPAHDSEPFVLTRSEPVATFRQGSVRRPSGVLWVIGMGFIVGALAFAMMRFADPEARRALAKPQPTFILPDPATVKSAPVPQASAASGPSATPSSVPPSSVPPASSIASTTQTAPSAAVSETPPKKRRHKAKPGASGASPPHPMPMPKNPYE